MMTRACVNSDMITELVNRLYGVDVAVHRKLPSYDDINFHVHVTPTSSNKHNLKLAEGGYVLKILNSDDSKMTDFLDAMHAAIEVACQNGITTSRPVRNVFGKHHSVEELPTEGGNETCQFVVRLFEFVPGEVLKGKPYTEELCWQVGRLAGQLDKALGDFIHPGLVDHKRYWSLTNVPNLKHKLHAVENEEKRNVIKSAIEQFENNVVPYYDKLKTGTIHADFNHENIIVVKERSGSEAEGLNIQRKYSVHGIIDFGDLVHEFPVFELGIVLSYMMTCSKVIDPLKAGGHVFAGYLSEFSIPSFDCDRLKECVAGRLSQSLVNGEFAYKQNPADSYCLESSKEAWPILKRLNSIAKHDLYNGWRRILEQYGIANPFP